MPLKFKPATFPDRGPLQPLRERTAILPRGRSDPREMECENNDENTLKAGMIVVSQTCASAEE